MAATTSATCWNVLLVALLNGFSNSGSQTVFRELLRVSPKRRITVDGSVQRTTSRVRAAAIQRVADARSAELDCSLWVKWVKSTHPCDTRRCLPRRFASVAATTWSFDVAREPSLFAFDHEGAVEVGTPNITNGSGTAGHLAEVNGRQFADVQQASLEQPFMAVNRIPRIALRQVKPVHLGELKRAASLDRPFMVPPPRSPWSCWARRTVAVWLNRADRPGKRGPDAEQRPFNFAFRPTVSRRDRRSERRQYAVQLTLNLCCSEAGLGQEQTSTQPNQLLSFKRD
jgi:hypothetical protein